MLFELTLFMDKDKITFKPAFVERYSKLTDFDTFKKICLTPLRRCIRVNTLKSTPDEIKKRLTDWTLVPVPWSKEGFWLTHKEGRRDVGNLREHALGYIYVQGSASQIPPVILDPQPGEYILDMCAAPGSKSSQIAMFMKNKGMLVANDYQGIRLQSLGINLQRMGIYNATISLMLGQRMKDVEFDRVLVDAPCSGTGTIRKSLKTLLIWNPTMIKRLASTQKKLIDNGFQLVKPGGTLVYSTCSLEPEENEAVVSFLLDKYPNAKLEDIDIPIKRSKVVESFEGVTFNPEVKKCLRIWPQDNDTEGFFVAKIKKLSA